MSKYAWSPGRISRSENTCGCGLHRSPAIELIASTNSEPISNSRSCASADDVALPDAGLEELEDVLVHAVDHRAGLGEQRDLVRALDLAGEHHHLLPVADVDARRAAARGTPWSRPGRRRAACRRRRPPSARNGAPRPPAAADRRPARWRPAGRCCRRPSSSRRSSCGSCRRCAFAADPKSQMRGGPVRVIKRVALALVERPVADVGAGGVPDVAGLEQQHRAQVGRLELLLHPREPVVAEAVEVDAVLPVNAVESGSRAWSQPGSRPSSSRPLGVQCRSTNGKPSLTGCVGPHDSRARPDCTTSVDRGAPATSGGRRPASHAPPDAGREAERAARASASGCSGGCARPRPARAPPSPAARTSRTGRASPS